MKTRITHVILRPFANVLPNLNYYFDTTEDYPSMFEHIKTQLRLRAGLSGLVMFRGIDLSDGSYILTSDNKPMYIATFYQVNLVEFD
jgi:hypothetical protein